VTDSSAPLVPEYVATQVHGLLRPPGVVYAAAVMTWVAATGTALLTLLVTATVLWLAAPIFENFESGPHNPRWDMLAMAAVVVAVCVLADVVAIFVLRGRRWAQWLLIALCVLAALGGIITSYYVAPLLVTATAGAVAVLLLLPDARFWFRTSRAA
jgi:dipeptide/tripeptide permease